MQLCAPPSSDITQEPAYIKKMAGLENEGATYGPDINVPAKPVLAASV